MTTSLADTGLGSSETISGAAEGVALSKMWSTVEHVRTGIQATDPQMLDLSEKLERSSVPAHSKGLVDNVKEETLAARGMPPVVARHL
jgi:hypothetical protein